MAGKSIPQNVGGKQQPRTIPPRLAQAMQGQMVGQAMQGKVRAGRGVMPRLLQALSGDNRTG